MNKTESLIIGYTINDKDESVLVVGKKSMNQVPQIINAFEGEEAKELYRKLTQVKKKEE